MIKQIKKTKKKIVKKVSKKKIEREKILEWKNKVRKRDNYMCQICGYMNKSNFRNLHVHHILDKKNFPQLKFDVNNGIVLCYRDHKVGSKAPHMNAIYFSEWLKTYNYSQWIYIKNISKKINK